MVELRKFVAPEFVFGPGAIGLTGRYAANFGARKVLVVTDAGVAEQGIAAKLCDILRDAGISSVLFSELSQNPRSEEVMAGAQRYDSQGCDVIIALGGGSPMDCAKGIGIVSTNKKNVLEFEGIDNVPIPGPPLICLPTTAGTAADISQFSIITDRRQKIKKAIISKTMVPDVALIDPELTVSMDSELTACTGMDALVHAIEAYVSTANSPITDLHALDAMQRIVAHLAVAQQRPGDVAIRGELALASLEAGMAFSNASLGAVHAMAHSCGALLDLKHGECNAILLDHVVGYNFDSAAGRYCNIAKIFGLPVDTMTNDGVKEELILAIQRLKHSVGIKNGLAARGVTAAELASLAGKAMKDPCMVTNPREPSVDDIERVYGQAL